MSKRIDPDKVVNKNDNYRAYAAWKPDVGMSKEDYYKYAPLIKYIIEKHIDAPWKSDFGSTEYAEFVWQGARSVVSCRTLEEEGFSYDDSVPDYRHFLIRKIAGNMQIPYLKLLNDEGLQQFRDLGLPF